eukprot:7383465-Prymnesium_polylepis.1
MKFTRDIPVREAHSTLRSSHSFNGARGRQPTLVERWEWVAPHHPRLEGSRAPTQTGMSSAKQPCACEAQPSLNACFLPQFDRRDGGGSSSRKGATLWLRGGGVAAPSDGLV